MRKNFTILLLTLFSILASFSYANQTLINQQNAQRFLDSQLQGQLEVDRQRREREAAAAQQYQYQEPRDDRIYHRYAVFVWNEDTGHFYGFPELLVAPTNNSKKEAIKLAKKEFKRIGNADGLDIKATDHLIWNGGLRYIVVMGTNRKTGKWEAFTKFEVDDENIKILINKCSETCDNCDFSWSN
ncbi:hypothetical protein [Fusobacterium nucleatum]|uniref:hypothetical protein n=1 Tax=Fusobacterium nucleatum TaxID=851 RepID=UPI0003B852D0|nr:hypothetical protein [Fusobacterium nucleatum]ERT42276.1 hypothetical protein HMPREF1539_01601 [Fusobacterium nucleatum CTI-2]